ncbi:hypothetical protein NUW54_g14314 [Trametes sanguinea]|uniref:Uncharacterized protein n=1 Tax=Trametes sanguinea TaxID=158606 RepID=A0ACC1ME24_9APHY|nr:hypothetical protein NUW54_g14314 [Trametes sanguinea]
MPLRPPALSIADETPLPLPLRAALLGPSPSLKSTLHKPGKDSADLPAATAPPIKAEADESLRRMQPSTPIKTSPSASKKRGAGVFPELSRPTPSTAGAALSPKGKGVAANHFPAHQPPEPFQPNDVEVQLEKEAYVVVRGERPGIYFDRTTAMLMLGTSPGMKLVRFRSVKKASWYFVQEYMAGHVGVPVVVVADD